MTGAVADPPPGLQGAERQLGCYSRLYSARARVLEPASVEDLKLIFAHAREAGRRITLRAGGHSFDGQAIGDDLVVSMLRFNAIEILPGGDKIRVGPGARWGDVLATLQPLGLAPAVTVTTENATAGGTLSGDCLSRFSPSYGKEGEWIESFDLLTTEGELLCCTPPEQGCDPADWTREERVFCGVIGGLGYLGAVVSITYRVLGVGSTDGRIGVRTLVRKFNSYGELADDLVPTAARTQAEDSDPGDPEKLDAIWSALDTRGDETRAALFFTSTLTKDPKRRRMLLHRPRMLLRIPAEWLMRFSPISRLLWRFYFRFLFSDGEEYVDDLEGYAFFMDGNTRAKRVGEWFGFSMRNSQQTFVVPSDPGAEGGWDSARDDLVEWLEFANEFLRQRGLVPTLNDALFLPEDRRFLLSASAGLPGFAVSYAFETSRRRKLEKIGAAFTELADVLWEKFGGRVYLVKNVFARPETLARMYGDYAAEFFALKAELDPGGLLRNEFLERTFGDRLGPGPRVGTGAG